MLAGEGAPASLSDASCTITLPCSSASDHLVRPSVSKRARRSRDARSVSTPSRQAVRTAACSRSPMSSYDNCPASTRSMSRCDSPDAASSSRPSRAQWASCWAALRCVVAPAAFADSNSAASNRVGVVDVVATVVPPHVRQPSWEVQQSATSEPRDCARAGSSPRWSHKRNDTSKNASWWLALAQNADRDDQRPRGPRTVPVT